ncbi:MAG: ATP-dependent RNA helicase HrpA, partial [Planctomycetota bacterium]
MMELSAPSLLKLVDGCMPADRRRLRARLRGGRGRKGADRRTPGPQALEAIARDIEASRAQLAWRRNNLPAPTFGQDLPIAARRDEIASAIRDNQVVVICGETGSGKTTQLPKICLELGRGVEGMIGHTQPRRIAARSVASRIASELKTDLGKAVGYKVRFGDRTSPETFVKLMTDGILLAETQGDRWLEQYDTLIIDEAHERGLNIDFLLGILKQLLPRRSDLKLIVTSATIDPERFSTHFEDAPIIEVSGRTYPVEVRYRPLESDDPDEEDRSTSDAILHAVDELAREDARRGGVGDVLVFLPGEREIRETAEALRKHHPPETEILPLYARLSADEQNRVFQRHPGRRIVLATNVAETSLTVPGIRYVIDTGTARLSRYGARGRLQRLQVERISQASAQQRSGRCGRIEPGVCIRLYGEDDFASREEFTPPEIVRTNLASVILQMKALKLGDVSDFPFLDRPDDRLIRDGYERLHELGAVDDDGVLTDVGVQLARLPIDPSIGRMLLAAEKEGSLAEVLVIGAALSVQDPRERPMEVRAAADEAHAQFVDDHSDFISLLNLWRWYQERSQHLSGSKLRKACKQNFLSYMRMREWIDTHRQLRRLMTEMGHKENSREASHDLVHRALMTGLLGNVGNLREPPEYVGTHGRRFRIFPGSTLFGGKSKWIMAGEIVRTTQVYARMVARIDPRWIEDVAGHLCRRHYSDPAWDAKSGRVMASERVTLFGLEVVPRRTRHYGPVNPDESRRMFIHHALVEGEWTSRAPFFEHNRQLVERVELMEEKVRRRDLLAEAHRRFDFYDRLLPADIYAGDRLEKWRRQVEQDEPRLLFMDEQDVLANDEVDASLDRYPDSKQVAGRRVDVGYRYHPGDDADGVTLTVPPEVLGAIDERDSEWLVPGMLVEKIGALIRALPKAHRRAFVPVPEVSARVASEITNDKGDFFEAVAAALSRISGSTIQPNAWTNVTLPEHLRMRVRVVDDEGTELGAGRDVRELRRQLNVRGPQSVPSDLDCDGLHDWNVGALPERIEIERSGKRVRAYPAMVDAGSHVGVRAMVRKLDARDAHRSGVRRLLAMKLGPQIESLLDQQGALDRLSLLHAPIGSPAELHGQITLLVGERACVGDADPPRDREAFERAMDTGWNQLDEACRRVCGLVEEVLSTRHTLQLTLEGDTPRAWDLAIMDVQAQMGGLLPQGFLLTTPWRWLLQVPRYLKGIGVRLSKLSSAGAVGVELIELGISNPLTLIRRGALPVGMHEPGDVA